MPLSWLAQRDFAAGAVRSTARHLIPESGVYSVENGLLDEDGSIYRRGGTEYLSNAAFGTGLRWVWDGFFPVGQRTLFASSSAFGVLAADGVTPILVSGAEGLAAPVRAAQVGGMLFIPPGRVYAGSRKVGPYITIGTTIAVTQGSTTVTGTGTTWQASGVDAGMLLYDRGRYYVVDAVVSDTSLRLRTAVEGATAAGLSYLLETVGTPQPAVPNVPDSFPAAEYYATVAERLIAVNGTRIAFSQGRSSTGVLRPQSFVATDYHELPEGSLALGAASVGDRLLVFATDGVWAINNMTFDLTDAAGNVQQSMQPTAQDVVLWGAAGIAEYRGALVVPGLDGVYLVDGASEPVELSRSITPLLSEHVRLGRKPGGAVVFRNHYFLPVLDSANVVVDLLVCRLDRPVRVRGQTFFPWSWLRGHAMLTAALTQRVSTTNVRQPELLGAGSGSDARVLKLTSMFAPSAARKSDADGTAHSLVVETRDYPTGGGNTNTVRRLRVRYGLEDAGTDNPTVSASYTREGGSAVSLAGAAPETSNPESPVPETSGYYTWLLQSSTRYVRVRLQSAAPAARLILRSIEIAVRPSGKDR